MLKKTFLILFLSLFSQNPIHSSIFTKDNSCYSKYEIGEWTYGNPKIFTWGNKAKLKVGRFCALSQEIIINNRQIA